MTSVCIDGKCRSGEGPCPWCQLDSREIGLIRFGLRWISWEWRHYERGRFLAAGIILVVLASAIWVILRGSP